MQTTSLRYLFAVLVTTLLASVSQADGTASQRLEPDAIQVGETARLTITESGNAAVTPPMVSGLEFMPASQSQRMESVNGISSTSTTVTYLVVPRHAGVFRIPSGLPGESSVVLTVNAGNGRSPAQGSPSSRSALPVASLPAEAARLNADGSAFVRLRLAKHELYVGETVPVDIEVGMREGLVASLNGLPTLNGDAFTLHKLSSEPARRDEVIGGRPFTVLTWHSALAAVKPGKLSLTVETPLTVRMRTRTRVDAGLFGDADLGDLFNDPMFQSFFGNSTERDITVASEPTTFAVMALPVQDRPANFSGAVGQFTVSGGISTEQAAFGDPLTVRMQVSGEGSFDRVSSPMLEMTPGFKSYAPTSTFKAADAIGYQGEKTFEQPLIATKAGIATVPPISFSWFDPSAKRYIVAHTSPMPVTIAPPSAGTAAAMPNMPTPGPNEEAAGPAPSRDGLRPDHLEIVAGAATLLPHFFAPVYLAAPTSLLIALSGSLLWIRRRDRQRHDRANSEGRPALEPQLKRMAAGSASRNPELFFGSARAALQIALATRWHCEPGAITAQLLDARLGGNNPLSRVFELADEAAYAGIEPDLVNYSQWTPVIEGYLIDEALT